MPPRSKKPAQKRRSRSFLSRIHWSAIAIPAAVVLVLMIAGFGVAANQEEHNSFCASCHTQPESTFYAQFQKGTSSDLATFHNTKDVKCIDCHSGSGIGGRLTAMMMGSRNALAYFTHTAKQPAPLTVSIGDGNCLKCHTDVLTKGGFNNHFHAFLARWQAVDSNAAGCVDCHTAHPTADATNQYLVTPQVQAVCQQCHQVMRE